MGEVRRSLCEGVAIPGVVVMYVVAEVEDGVEVDLSRLSVVGNSVGKLWIKGTFAVVSHAGENYAGVAGEEQVSEGGS